MFILDQSKSGKRDPRTIQERSKCSGYQRRASNLARLPYCEMESEPAFFSITLEEFGVKEVRAQELFCLDNKL